MSFRGGLHTCQRAASNTDAEHAQHSKVTQTEPNHQPLRDHHVRSISEGESQSACECIECVHIA